MRSAKIRVEEVRRVSGDPRLLETMRCFYEGLDAEIASHRPLCWNRGTCCKFRQYGHRLFVTPLELAYFMAGEAQPVRATAEDRCPYQTEGRHQVEGRCTARDQRPMGCRIFFCQAASRHWQPDLTERSLEKLQELHDRFGATYAYVDWIFALQQVGGKAGRLDTQQKAPYISIRKER